MTSRITVNQVPIEWNTTADRFTFFGIEGIILWKDPSLLSILGPLRTELGEDLFALMLAFEVSRGTHDDYYQMVENLGGTFEEGFTNWGRAVSGAGWGVFHLESVDWANRTARVRIDRPWELQLFPEARDDSAVPFMDGKISGIFSWAFGTNCRTRLIERGEAEGDPFVRLEARPSSTTLAHELEQLQDRRGVSQEELLQATNRSLREHLDRYFDALSATGEFVWEMDADRVIRFATEPMGQLLGRSAEGLEGARLGDFLTEGARVTLNRHLTKNVHRDRSGRQVELQVIASGGETRTLSVGIRPTLDLGGHVTGYRGAGRDITRQRAQEQELAAYQADLEEAVRRRTEELERFTEATAHHLQEPLRQVGAFVTRLERRFQDPEAAERDPDVARIQAGVNHMSELLHGLQRYLALDAGALAPTTLPTDRALWQAWESLTETERPPDATLEPQAPLPLVHADPDQLQRLFQLLLTNAVTYAREATPPRIRVSAQRQGTFQALRVHDNGRGVEPDYRERVFRMFERLEPRADPAGSGTGLPLARKIVEAHGGRIWLEDPPDGTGTTVAFTLPAAEGPTNEEDNA